MYQYIDVSIYFINTIHVLIFLIFILTLINLQYFPLGRYLGCSNFHYCNDAIRAFLLAQGQRICLQCRRCKFDLGWEDPLEKKIETYSNILAWKILWTEEPGRLQSMRSQKSQT